MRIVIDMQGAQSTGSRNRGIGRYSLSLALAMVRNRGRHEVFLALNALFPNTIEPIRAAFEGLLPQENIRVWTSPAPVNDNDPSNLGRREASERIREAFLAGLNPDIVHISSLFEGLMDDSVTSVGVFSRSIPTAVTFYDLIPLIHSKLYLEAPITRNWYLRKIDHLRRADFLLAISESSRRDAIDYLGLPRDSVINISTAAEDCYQRTVISSEAERQIRQQYGLTRPFLMYTGGIDHRKNIERLIHAFASLPKGIRAVYQLAVVCSVQPESRQALEKLARTHGLKPDEVVLTGYVPTDDLVALYNLCKLFVFPSWYEGFGLPALEAMRCGAPVIAANTSSLPEAVGRKDALFDPFSIDAIAAKISEVLTNDAFRADLVSHGIEQAKKFSWDESARRAITAFERLHDGRQECCKPVRIPVRRPKLAYVSPLPPEHSGIADYSGELLPELARYYDIEAVVTQPEVSDPWIKACLPVRSVEWFIQHAGYYDRVLYHMGNSPFHQHMFGLLDRFPGIVVLHDFFLGSLKAHLELSGLVPNEWVRELYDSHGYIAVCERFRAKDLSNTIFKYPCNFSVIRRATGVIVHSAYPTRLAEEWYGDGGGQDWAVIPLLRAPAAKINKEEARSKVGLEGDEFVVCTFGKLGPIKQNHRLLRSWLNSSLSRNRRCRLVFVGENDNDDYGKRMVDTIRKSGLSERIGITGWTDADTFKHYLAAADLAVQLRTLSRGETSAAILDCMNYGLPVIANANGSIAELPQDAIWMLQDDFQDAELTAALEKLWSDAEHRQALAAQAKQRIDTHHVPRECAKKYAQVIENFYTDKQLIGRALVSDLSRLESMPVDEESLLAAAKTIAQNNPLKRPARQLLIDISTLIQMDAKTGIQRVTRSILHELLLNPPHGYRVEPVYATLDGMGYRYARAFSLRFLGCPEIGLIDDLIEAQPGDFFLGLDLQHSIVQVQAEYLEALRNRGINISFMIYDLLPIRLPDDFQPEMKELHEKWLSVVARIADGVICISQSVADELMEWLNANGLKRLRSLKIGWNHLGGDLENSVPSSGMPADADKVLQQISARPSFLIVGTVEPRKGHAETFAAMEQLWAENVDVNLVIVGQQGWKVEDLAEILRNHPEFRKRLFWLEGISDEYLNQVYASCTCLIAASKGEGFGLPLIEAAQHKLPIIARDIPVFREVAGEQAFYFSSRAPSDIAAAIKGWLDLYRLANHPGSDGMQWLTWEESAKQLLDIILNDRWYASWE